MTSPVFRGFPDLDTLLSWSAEHPVQKPIPSNLHIHTPHSFSAFTDIHEAVALAREQGVFVLGINDFNTTEGYKSFTEECQEAGVFPAYCMETITLSVGDQESGKRWNDPGNPGRIYLCGKGLRYPARLSKYAQDTLLQIAQALEKRMKQMVDRMNSHLKNALPDIQLSYDHILNTMTEGTVRERHIAKALQQAIAGAFPTAAEKAKVLKALYGVETQIDVMDNVALQNELRANLLKAGKVAYVEEKPETFLSLEDAKSLILDMGGIPCYTLLIDGTKGELTEAERDPESLCDEILRNGIYCAEFIPTRNDINLLKKYASVLKGKGIILTAGTEHNTPKMEPMTPMCSGGVELDETLKEMFWKGACVIAAHQYLTSMERVGYVDAQGNRTDEQIAKLESIGEAVIAYYLANIEVN